MRLLLIHSASLMLALRAMLAVLVGRRFVKTRRALAWPTPFEFSPRARRSPRGATKSPIASDGRRPSGAQLDRVWRAEQGFHAETGWTDGHLQIAPVVTITPKDPAP